ncbi:hypothetical protein BAGA_08605 [Bacillus gaemokensis]|uniref:ABC transporter permease n=1 Tax=Bacillus gaemokensis TaxID=574375 RepID=A0A073KAF2_9BACI|nr:hypothetical protein BAGA_08605 [Bacillus gaemokensis]KYG27095.1 hypothetical protein AZF08_15135 [Bacillus gaemokensis]
MIVNKKKLYSYVLVIGNSSITSFMIEVEIGKGFNHQYTKLFTTELGIGIAIVYMIIAFYFLKRRDELSI